MFQYIPYRTHRRIGVPTVIDGNNMWKQTEMANCHRAKVSRSTPASANVNGNTTMNPMSTTIVMMIPGRAARSFADWPLLNMAT
jgi:CxxC motif-containing protein (DUF1111 family)